MSRQENRSDQVEVMKTGDTLEDEKLPVEQRGHAWFRKVFNKQVAEIALYPKGRDGVDIRLQTDRVNLRIKLLTPIILRRFPDGQYELLIGETHKSGYSLGDHMDILLRYWLTPDSSITYIGLYFEAGRSRYLMVNNLDCAIRSGKYSHEEQLIIAMKSYGIKKVFSVKQYFPDLENGNPNIEVDEKKAIDVDNWIKAIDDVLRANYIVGLAILFNWTNQEMLRFKLTGELPEWKLPAYNK